MHWIEITRIISHRNNIDIQVQNQANLNYNFCMGYKHKQLHYKDKQENDKSKDSVYQKETKGSSSGWSTW